MSGTQSESVKNPCAIVVPNGPSAARTGSTWIHCGSSVAFAKPSMRSWSITNQSVGPSSLPIRSVNALTPCSPSQRASVVGPRNRPSAYGAGSPRAAVPAASSSTRWPSRTSPALTARSSPSSGSTPFGVHSGTTPLDVVPRDVEALEPAREEDRLPLEPPVCEPQAREPVEQQAKRDAQLEPGERRPDAEVHALAERQVPVQALAMRVVVGRTREDGVVAVCGPVVHHHARAGGERRAADRHLARRRPIEALGRRLEAQDFLDCERDEGRIRAELLRSARLAEDQDERITDGPGDGHVTRDDEIERDPHDRVSGQRRLE